MEWYVILAIILAVPVILIPFVFIWYMNASGIYTVIRETMKRRALRRKREKEVRPKKSQNKKNKGNHQTLAQRQGQGVKIWLKKKII